LEDGRSGGRRAEPRRLQTQQRWHIRQRADDRHLAHSDQKLLTCGVPPSVHENATHPYTEGAEDVVRQAIADHDGLSGRHVDQPQRRLEDARMRLEKTVF
jgi:hypothetical protein